MEQYLDETFTKVTSLATGEYEQCTFEQCDLNGANLAGCCFIDCTFNGCNLSTARLLKTAFQEVRFTGCKLMGMRFDTCDTFLLSFFFHNCTLSHSVFTGLKLKGVTFSHCQLTEAEFTDADLANVPFTDTDLSGAVFDNTNLSGADLCTALNFSINPARNNIKKAKFSLHGLPGLLHQHDIVIEL